MLRAVDSHCHILVVFLLTASIHQAGGGEVPFDREGSGCKIFRGTLAIALKECTG